MTDVNEQSFSAGTKSDTVAATTGRSLRSRIPPPIWRLRPALQPVNVVRVIKTQIIPKFVLALKSMPATQPAEALEQDQPNSVQKFAILALGNNENAAKDHVAELLDQGASVEDVFLNLLAPAARHFGELWETDATDFANVSIAMSRLQRILRELAERPISEDRRGDHAESALLTTIPGEQHSFGLLIVSEFFRRDGWNLCTGPFSSHRELTSLVHSHWFDVVGFSVSSDRRLGELKQDVDHIRHDSRNKNIGIILGGPMLVTHPEIASDIGADMISVDATTAPQQARSLISEMKLRA